MPKAKKLKLKTKKILSKRVSVTGTGKYKRQHVATSHLKEKQSSRTKRRKSRDEIASPSDTKTIKRLLPYS